MTRYKPRLTLLLTVAMALGCGEEPPSVTSPLTPVDPQTFEVRLPWSQFASNLQVLGGFGRPSQTGTGLIARDFEGELQARTLLRLGPFPRSVSVLDSLGTTRTDTTLTFISGALIVVFDTASATRLTTASLRLDRLLEPWDARTATWDFAVDSGGVRIPWSAPGGGASTQLHISPWLPGTGVDAFIPLNAAQIALLGDTTRTDRGLMLSMETPGARLDVAQVLLQLHTVPSLNQDSTLFLVVNPTQLTYVYSPAAEPPAEPELRAGGAPAWRSLFTLGLPPSVPGSPVACARISCPVALTADRINHASLLLTTKPSIPSFAPTDTMGFEVRGVLAPEVLPKSPLTGPLFVDSLGIAAGTTVLPGAFRPGFSRVVEVPITPLVRSLLAGSVLRGFGPTPTVTLMELFEPRSFPFASFVGPGQPGEPILRLVLTVADPVGLP